MPKMLLVLVDGLPHWKINPELTPFLNRCRPTPLEPGFGFSVNLYVELFAGRLPDETGFFNKWTIRDPAGPSDPGMLETVVRQALDVSRINFAMSRALHKAIEKVANPGPIGNVPFRFLPYFRMSPKDDIFGRPDYPTIFHVGPWVLHVGSWIKKTFGRRDEVIFEQAMRSIDAGDKSVFAALTDVDAVSHAMGMTGSFDWVAFAKGVHISLDEHIRKVDRWCEKLAERARERWGDDARVVFLSDHGMGEVDPRGQVDLGLERRFGDISSKRYLYMLESTMMRLWCWDPVLRREIADYLSTAPGGVLLTDQDRAQFGVSNEAFAHEIFLLDEGKIFFPNFFGGRFPKAMHGWHPRCPSQLGIFTALGCGDSAPPELAREVYGFARDQLE